MKPLDCFSAFCFVSYDEKMLILLCDHTTSRFCMIMIRMHTSHHYNITIIRRILFMRIQANNMQPGLIIALLTTPPCICWHAMAAGCVYIVAVTVQLWERRTFLVLRCASLLLSWGGVCHSTGRKLQRSVYFWVCVLLMHDHGSCWRSIYIV